MDLRLSILLLANLVIALALLWGVVSMSTYIRRGKGWAFAMFAFSPVWLFMPGWFTDEGQQDFKKARAIVGMAWLFSVGVFYLSVSWKSH